MHLIRKATPEDIPVINLLLGQVLAVHHNGRPDLFRESGKKYTDAQLLELLGNPARPVFVYEENGEVLGYVFLEEQFRSSGSLMPVKTLYVDDLCVDEKARGRHVGQALLDFAKQYAREGDFYNLTLHVWAGNAGAQAFYEAQGLSPQYTCLELIVSGKVEL